MSNSQQQSLNEDVIFLPVTESCPEFLYSEGERHAVETLMSADPGAFYACLGTERLGCFLSPREVNQIRGWAQDYHISQLQVGGEEDGEECASGMDDFSACYFPAHSDAPAPCLELGWPERSACKESGRATVYTSPPEDGKPSIREVIRWNLQGASKVIAIVTDRLTDSAVIGDLHNAASRGVPVYIILNRRSTQENFTPNRLRHPNMQVRVLGGKTFCSREGKMVVGELKNNFLLVDLETVIHGSYSLTWTDAHLHRQLVTVLSGPVVGSFDREFRILFAASFSIPDTGKVVRPPMDSPYQQKELSDVCGPEKFALESVTSPPPPPPAECPLDWEALGVVQRNCYFSDGGVNEAEEIIARERSFQNNMASEKHTAIMGESFHNRHKQPDEGRAKKCDNTPPAANNNLDKQSSAKFTQLSPTDGLNPTDVEMQQRVEHIIERADQRELSSEWLTDANERTGVRARGDRRETQFRQNIACVSPTPPQRDRPPRENAFQKGADIDDAGLMGLKATSRKPVILRMPQTENGSSLSDIMKRLYPQKSSSAQHGRGLETELSRSMMDLSVHSTKSPHERGGFPVPRLQINNFDADTVTPALALMRKRNDEIKFGLLRTPNLHQPSARPRSSSYGLHLDWRRPQNDSELARKTPE